MTREDEAYWRLQLVDPDPPVSHEMGMCSLAAGDIDNDGNVELIAGGDGKLLWYRPATHERGVIAEGRFHVGLTLEDVDSDGKLEIVTSEYEPGGRVIWFKPPADLRADWHMHIIDPDLRGCHDIVFADIDNDGKKELITAAVSARSVDIYKPGTDPSRPWQRQTIMSDSKLREGTDAADVNGDGRMEIMCGPSLFTCTGDEPFKDEWVETLITWDFRNMCRTAFTNVTGSGLPDILICESEYLEGKLSWFENRYSKDPDNPWVEHEIDYGLAFGHSMQVLPVNRKGMMKVFIAEMAEGGWDSPRNRDARIMTYKTADGGASWECTVHSRGVGTHQAFTMDIDGDGEEEVAGKEWKRAQVQVFKRLPEQPSFTHFKHRFIDLDKPYTAVDLFPCDINGSGEKDIVCGAWWYRSGDWRRFNIPGIEQVIEARDIDGDGRVELICLDKSNDTDADAYDRMSESIVLLKAVDPEAEKWEKYPIGIGRGDWPHGAIVAPILPGGRQALVIAHHDAWHKPLDPELFEMPENPTSGPWPKRSVAPIQYSEEIAAADFTGNGLLDLACGEYLLANNGDGTFKTRTLIDDFKSARISAADISGNGRPDIILAEQCTDTLHEIMAPTARLVWLENGADWKTRVIDNQLRFPHSLGVADIDGDGEYEIILGEHDPTRSYRSRCRLIIYKKADSEGTSWYRYVIDDRFEHHCGAKVFEIQPDRWAIASHGWVDSIFVHLWVQD